MTWSQKRFFGSLGAAKGEKHYMLTRYVSRKRGEGGQEEQNRTEIMLKHQINKLTHNDSSSGALLACLSVNAKQFFSLWPAFVQI